jgi:hypothetical protein
VNGSGNVDAVAANDFLNLMIFLVFKF